MTATLHRLGNSSLGRHLSSLGLLAGPLDKQLTRAFRAEPWGNRMPGIDYRQVRARIPMARVLELLDYRPKTRRGHQLRGPCPIHASSTSQSTIFAVHLAKQVYYCHRCQSGGDQLHLWQAIHKRPLYWSTLDLCQAAGIEVPWLKPTP